MIDIKNIVNTNFSISQVAASVGGYKKVLFIGNKSGDTNFTPTDADKKIFSDCGGNPENIIPVNFESAAATMATTILAEKKKVAGTEDDFIFVCFAHDTTVTAAYFTTLLAGELSQTPYKIIPCISMDHSDVSITVGPEDPTLIIDSYASLGVAVKLYPGNNPKNVALTIPAYYSTIRLNDTYTLQDYCYTAESIDETDNDVVEVTQAEYEKLISVANFINTVGKSKVNFGGNLTNSVAITTMFGDIAVENDITNAVLGVMLAKQYLTDAGLTNVVAAISEILDKYALNGYLQTKSVYSGNTEVSSYNGAILIEKNQVLPKGYLICTIPMAQLKPEDRRQHKFTPITIFMQTQTGARKVEIGGVIAE